MFNDAAANSVVAAAELKNLFLSTSEAENAEMRQKIKQIEKKGDEITNHLFDELNRTFITPFDREDIHELTSKLDDVVDLIYSVSGKVDMYKFTQFSDHMVEMGELLYQGSIHLQHAVAGLENSRNAVKSLKIVQGVAKNGKQGGRMLPPGPFIFV